MFCGKKNKDLFTKTADNICNNISKILNIPSQISCFEYFDSVTNLCRSLDTVNHKLKNNIKEQNYGKEIF